MINGIINSLRILSVLLGVFMILTRVFTVFAYEGQRGKIQSALEGLWVRIDDFQQLALSRHVMFMRVVSGMMLSGFNAIFGKRLVSLQSITVSVCYAITTSLIGMFLLIGFGSQGWNLSVMWWALPYAIAGTLPAVFKLLFNETKKALLIWLTVLITLAISQIVVPLLGAIKAIYVSPLSYLTSFILIGCACVVIGIVFFWLSITLVRVTLRRINSSTSFPRILLISLLNLLPIAGVYLLFRIVFFIVGYIDINTDPALDYAQEAVFKTAWASSKVQVTVFLVLLMVTLTLFEFVFLFSAAIFALLSILMLLHRLLWPVLLRLLYASQQYRVVDEGKVLIYIGIILIVIGLGDPALIKWVWIKIGGML